MVQIYGSGAAGYLNTALVTDAGELLITGSVSTAVSVGDITASSSSDYKISGTHTGIGSVSLIGGDYGGSVFPVRIFNGSYIMMAGSISSIPSVTATNEAVGEIGTEHLGSAIVVAGDNGGNIMPLRTTTGSVLEVSQISTTGSVSTYFDGGIGSVLLTPGSLEVYQTTNSDMQVQATQETSPWVVSGTATVEGNVTSNLGSTYATKQIIRLSSGSPATNFVFGGVSRSVFIDVIGSNPVYFNFDGDANPANSGTGFLFPGNTLNLDIHAGSVSIQSSGATATEVQVINIR